MLALASPPPASKHFVILLVCACGKTAAPPAADQSANKQRPKGAIPAGTTAWLSKICESLVIK